MPGFAIDDDTSNVFAWYRDGTVSMGNTEDLDSKRRAYPFSPPTGVAASGIVGLGVHGATNLVTVWYRAAARPARRRPRRG